MNVILNATFHLMQFNNSGRGIVFIEYRANETSGEINNNTALDQQSPPPPYFTTPPGLLVQLSS